MTEDEEDIFRESFAEFVSGFRNEQELIDARERAHADGRLPFGSLRELVLGRACTRPDDRDT